jgi:hypothetical protein
LSSEQRVQIVRDDGGRDALAGRCFSSYEAAYDELERYYADLCCSDDREYYRIVPLTSSS